ncbi:MAG: sigma-70 family RNA polymerase sigma factor [Patescibacteria group bacterium]
MKNFTDEQLVKNYLKGDEKSLEEIVRRYLTLVYNFSRRYAGDPDNTSDIVQEVFVKVWKNLKRFDASKNFRTWLFTVAKNTALDWLKKRNTIPFSLLLEDVADSEQISVIDKIYQKSLSQNLALAIEKLPPKYSSVINLYHKDDLNFREIASFLNESINTVKSRYRRGLIILKKAL